MSEAAVPMAHSPHQTGSLVKMLPPSTFVSSRGKQASPPAAAMAPPAEAAPHELGPIPPLESRSPKTSSRHPDADPSHIDRVAEFWASVRAGNADKVRELLQQSPALASTADENGTLPVSHAARSGHLDMLDLLAQVLSKSKSHSATVAEFWASIRDGNADKVRELLQRSPALASTADENGRLPLYHAARSGHMGVAQLLVSAPGPEPEPPAVSALFATSKRLLRPPADWPHLGHLGETVRRSRPSLNQLRVLIEEWNAVFASLQSIRPREDDFPDYMYNTVRFQCAAVFPASILPECAQRAAGEWLELLLGDSMYSKYFELKTTALLSSAARYTAQAHVHVTLCDVEMTDDADEFDESATTVLFSSEFHRAGRGMRVSGIVRGVAARFPAALPTWSELGRNRIHSVPINRSVSGSVSAFLGDNFRIPPHRVRVWQMTTDPSRLVLLVGSVTFHRKDPWFVVDGDPTTGKTTRFVPSDLRLTAAVLFFLARYTESAVFVSVADQGSELYEALECDGGVVLVRTGCHLLGAPPPSSSSQQRFDEEDAHAKGEGSSLSRSILKTVGFASNIADDEAWHAGVAEAAARGVALRSVIGTLRGLGWSNRAIAVGTGYRGRSNGRVVRRMLDQRCDVSRRLKQLLALSTSRRVGVSFAPDHATVFRAPFAADEK